MSGRRRALVALVPVVAALAAGTALPAAASPVPAARAGVPGAAPPAAGEACEEGRTQYVADTPAGLIRLAATRAWPLATGRGVTVAVVDSGVAAANAHFPKGSVLPGRSFVGGSATTDKRLHGTAVAGIIAARPLASRSGVQGLAKRATILPVKVVPDEQDDRAADADAGTLAEAIVWAADQGAKVINVSLSTTRDDPRLAAAVATATSRGALVVASAGTATAEDSLPVTGVRYPAGYRDALGVAATDADDTVARTSVRGEQVDVAAPGVDVLTTFGAWGDCYLSADDGSTSYATGYVSAAAALLAQRFPAEGPRGWAHRLEATAARERRDARDDAVGWGLVQPVEALTAVLDAGVAGPLLPGATPTASPRAVSRRVAVGEEPDPLAADRRQVLWVAVAGTSLLLGLALVRLQRRRPTA
ncbi:S8 family serine peptidase [Phycicoccus duodecadis]|uniref:Subtilase family protein n=1 Tax=Phycicoccus duodecadis TaxID=173053 RepID=A0A2N3YMI4_9MICO|nr:S8 family serine peptidase [Phycicoccus duodecadis]PKW28044.1 subtilase family protein [Phycicoccus duodecadis]